MTDVAVCSATSKLRRTELWNHVTIKQGPTFAHFYFMGSFSQMLKTKSLINLLKSTKVSTSNSLCSGC